MTTKPYVETCSVDPDCMFETDDSHVMDHHIADRHPEMLEDDPMDRGDVYKQMIHREWRREDFR